MSVIEIQPLDVVQDLDKLINQMKGLEKDLVTFDDQCVRTIGCHYYQYLKYMKKRDYYCDFHRF